MCMLGGMGRTSDAITTLAGTGSTAVEAAGAARATFYGKAPTERAQKLFLALLDAAGVRVPSDVVHAAPLADLRRRMPAARTMRRREVAHALASLCGTVMAFEPDDGSGTAYGPLLADAFIERGDARTLHVRWTFSSLYRHLARQSDVYTKLDLAVMHALGSRYAVALAKHIASHVEKQRVNMQEFSVDELRRVLGVPDGKLPKFAEMNRNAIRPAIEQINLHSPWRVEAHFVKKGKWIRSVVIKWQDRPLSEQAAADAEARRHSAGRRARANGEAERPFTDWPESVQAFRGSVWEREYRRAGCTRSIALVMKEFRTWQTKNGKPLAPQVFYSYCKNLDTRRRKWDRE